MSDTPCDSLLFVSFGGPERREDVLPFLENVLRGRNVPRERMLEVAEHYYHFDGVSPINQQNRELIEAVTAQLRERGIDLPIYWGNRNWSPLLTDTLQQMTRDGRKHALAFVTAAFSSYSSCRQYRENLEAACSSAGESAPQVEKVRVFFNHPDFIAANADRVQTALQKLPEAARKSAHIAFTAHSIPVSMASQCSYAQQLHESCRLVAAALRIPETRWKLVYQSRSGRPEDPWLDPDILDHIRSLKEARATGVVVAPIGFLSDHMEVMYDLDEEAQQLAQSLELPFARAGTVGTHERFVTMVRKLFEERLFPETLREAVGSMPAAPDTCALNCCPAPRRPAAPAPVAPA